MLGLLLTLALLSSPAEAASVLDACRALTNKDRAASLKCVSHAEFFELNSAFIDACTAFHPDVEMRTRCLKSGANLEIIKICKDSGWTLDGTLTCLRSYPTPEIMKTCKQLSGEEEEQIKCVRSGREKAQIESCMALTTDTAGRFQCLQMDIPFFEAQRCSRANKGSKARIGCLEDYVAKREDNFRREQAELRGREIASQPSNKKSK